MANSTQLGVFVPTTNIWGDAQQFQSSQIGSEESKELLVRLYQNVNNIALALNMKSTGIHPLDQTVSGKLYFPNPNNSSHTAANPQQRQAFLQEYYITSLPPGTLTTPHGITVTGLTSFINIKGTANDTVGFNYYPISAGSAATIEIYADTTNFYITNNTAITFNVVYVTLEFLQS